MRRSRAKDLLPLILYLPLFFASSTARPLQTASGLVVEQVSPGSAAQEAGIRPGDVLLSWHRAANPPANPAANHGLLRTPFDVREIEIEQSPRGSLRINGLRNKKPFVFELSPEKWNLTVRPRLDARDAAEYDRARRDLEQKEFMSAASVMNHLAAKYAGTRDYETAAWVLWQLSEAEQRSSREEDANEAFRRAAELARSAATWRVEAQVWELRAQASKDDLVKRASYERSVGISEAHSADSLALAWTLRALGLLARDRNDFGEAERMARRALSLRQRLAPESVAVAQSLMDLGILNWRRGQLADAENLLKQAIAIARRGEPGNSTLAISLRNLGNVLAFRSDSAGAEALYLEALATDKRKPMSSDTGLTVMNLGILAHGRGEYVDADIYYRRALAILQATAPEKKGLLAGLMANQGNLALDRGDLSAAKEFARASISTCDCMYQNLNLAAAVAFEQGDYNSAEDLGKRALAKTVNDSEVADVLFGLGDTFFKRGDLDMAEAYYTTVGAIRETTTPNDGHAAALHSLGRVRRQRGDPAGAADLFARAVHVLEAEKPRLGGSEERRSSFAARFSDFYRDLIEVLVQLHRPAEAFALLERFRADSLRRLLAYRDLVFSLDIPADLERDRKAVDFQYDELQAEIRELSPREDSARITEKLARLQQIRAEQAGIADRIRSASPRYASLQNPRPYDLTSVRQTLDGGTLLLAYSVGKEKTFLFAVEPLGATGPGLTIFELREGEKTLRGIVEAFIEQLSSFGPVPSRDLLSRSQSLYDRYVKPAEGLISRYSRVLILADGPLHTLPWAVLVRGFEGDRPQYFVEWKPLHTVISVSVYAELTKARKNANASRDPSVILEAFGDPKYPKLPERSVYVKRGEREGMTAEAIADEYAEVEDPLVRSVARGGFRFEPLPESRKEVEQIAALYTPRAAAYLGPDATEERAKAIGKDVAIIHFATHAVINERFPLDSALVFTIPEHPKEGQDNGLLQAWEIFERMRIDADLVTLSACESGLGKEMGGEGLIGLTRAFQYAGARSVLASLWKVEDKATAELMKRFYTYLKAGKTKDEALRSAQIDLIHSRDYSNPRDWAAFQLNGDWK